MKVIVIGAGKVGRTIIENICKEGHEVVVIDNNANNMNSFFITYKIYHNSYKLSKHIRLIINGGCSVRQGRVLRRAQRRSVRLYSTALAQKQGARLPKMRRRR